MPDTSYLARAKIQVVLDAKLAAQFETYQEHVRESTIQICLLAASVRAAHLSSNGKSYTAKFESWWKTYGMDRVFGGRNNFVKYAKAGEAIKNVEGRYKRQRTPLPTSMSALYEISQLTDNELTLCLQHTYSRKSLSERESEWKGRSTKPLIHPHVTAAQIRSWREKWNNPPKPRADKRTIPLIDIKIHGSIFDLNDLGEPDGEIGPSEIKDYVHKIERLFAGTDSVVSINSNLVKILAGIERRKDQASKRRAKKIASEQKKQHEQIKAEERYSAALARWEAVVLSKMKGSAREFIWKMKRNQKKFNKPWGFTNEETNLGWVESRSDLQQALDTLGNDDQYEKIREDAECRTPFPKLPKILEDLEKKDEQPFDKIAVQIKNSGKPSKKNYSALKT